MRKIAVVQLLAGQHAVYMWIASKENPAGAPSSWYAARARQRAGPSSSIDMCGLCSLLVFCEVLSLVHGEQRCIAHVQARAHDVGLRLVGIGGRQPDEDIAGDAAFSHILCAAQDGRLAVVHVALPRDVRQRNAKGTRHADMRAWDRRVLRYERA